MTPEVSSHNRPRFAYEEQKPTIPTNWNEPTSTTTYRKEFDAVKSLFDEHDVRLNYRKAPATVKFLKDSLQRNVLILHISNRADDQSNFLNVGARLQGPSLLLEDDHDECLMLTVADLQQILSKTAITTQCVILSSTCHE